MAEDLNKADVNEIPSLGDLTPIGDLERSGNPETPPAKEGAPPPPESSPEGEASSASGQEETPPSTEGEGSATPEGEGNEPPAGEEEGTPPKGTEGAQTAPTITADQQNNLLSEMTGGRVETQEDLGAVLEHYQELRDFEENVRKDPKSLLPEGKARAVFDYVMKQPGENYNGSIQRYYHVLGLGEAKDLSPKEAQFEAFMLNDNNADLSREEGKRLFDLEYNETYADGLDVIKDQNPLLHRKHEVDTNEARKLISDMQTTFQTETAENTSVQQQPGYSEEEFNEFAGEIDTALDDFGGIAVAFDKDAKPEDRVNFVLDDPEDMAQFAEILKDPGEWWKDVLSSQIDAKGDFDANAYRDAMLIRVYPEKFAQVMYDQGFQRGIISNEADIKNVSGVPGGVTPGTAPDKTLHEVWGDAMSEAN